MDRETLLSIFISWFPMLLLISVWIFFMHRMKAWPPKSGLTQFQYLEEMLRETRRHNELLERLLANTNERLTILERQSAEKRS